MPTPEIWFWQTVVTPHIAYIAEALAKEETVITYVAIEEMTADRRDQGWQPPTLQKAEIKIAPDSQSVKALVAAAPTNSIHICQGLRSNGLVGLAQRCLAKRRLRQWVVMEGVDDSGWLGWLKRPLYRYHFWRWRKYLSGVLATGINTCDWVVSRGVNKQKVFPFAYFLAPAVPAEQRLRRQPEKFRLIFVGNLIERKRVGLMIRAIAELDNENIELVVIGGGPLESSLKVQGEQQLPGRIEWKGRLPMHQVPNEIAAADCLVLPSRHDGWGAVVSEALMVGTPVICSDACGAAEVVKASRAGAVFPTGDLKALIETLARQVGRGPVTDRDRAKIAAWAKSLSAQAGAAYLLSILVFSEGKGPRPSPPWVQC